MGDNKDMSRILRRKPSRENLARPCHVVFLGAAQVGKTSLIRAICGLSADNPSYKPVPTVEDLYRYYFPITSTLALPVDILDTSGTYNFPDMRRLAIQHADVIVLVYVPCDKASFEQVSLLHREIRAIRPEPELQIIVLANMGKGHVTTIELVTEEDIASIEWECKFVAVPSLDSYICQSIARLIINSYLQVVNTNRLSVSEKKVKTKKDKYKLPAVMACIQGVTD